MKCRHSSRGWPILKFQWQTRALPVVASLPVPNNKPPRTQLRFGIGEWYGTPLTALSAEERRKFAVIQSLPNLQKPTIACPFQSTPERTVACNKPGGVCSLRLYE